MGTPAARTLRLIAFLRAINVGGHNVKMDHLRGLFESLGFSNVETFIASGNVIFDPPGEDPPTIEKKIESHLGASLGYEVATFIRSTTELADIVSFRPFSARDLDSESNSLYIAFLPASPDDEARERLLARRTEIDDFRVRGREAYWLCREVERIRLLGRAFEKTLGMPATMRNANTINRLVAKYPTGEDMEPG